MLYEGAEAAAESAKETVLHFADMADNATVESSSAEQAVLMVHWMGYGNEEAIVGVDFHCPDATKRPCSEDDACAYLAILRQLESTKEKVVIAFTFGNVSYDQGAPAQRAEGR